MTENCKHCSYVKDRLPCYGTKTQEHCGPGEKDSKLKKSNRCDSFLCEDLESYLEHLGEEIFRGDTDRKIEQNIISRFYIARIQTDHGAIEVALRKKVKTYKEAVGIDEKGNTYLPDPNEYEKVKYPNYFLNRPVEGGQRAMFAVSKIFEILRS